MTNTPTAPEDKAGQPDPAWRDALAVFDADLRRRGAAEKTRRAYGFDLGQFALWCTTLGLDPDAVDMRALRRYAALLSDRGMSATTVARKLAALRAFYRSLREHGVVADSPADLLPAPKRPARLPTVLTPEEVASLLERIPASTPLELRDRALFEIAYASGLRAEELVNLDLASVDFDAEELRVEGKGGKTRFVPAGEPALRALARYLERARSALVQQPDEPALFVSKTGRRLSTSDIRRRLKLQLRSAALQGGVTPHTLRHSFATH